MTDKEWQRRWVHDPGLTLSIDWGNNQTLEVGPPNGDGVCISYLILGYGKDSKRTEIYFEPDDILRVSNALKKIYTQMKE